MQCKLWNKVNDPSVVNQLPEGSLALSVLSSLQCTTSHGYAPSSVTNPSTLTTSQPNPNGKLALHAQVVPSTNAVPDISLCTTKAVALHAGITYNDTRGARVVLIKEQEMQNFMDVPRHKHLTTIAVDSTVASTIVPRMTKVAAPMQEIKPLTKVK